MCNDLSPLVHWTLPVWRVLCTVRTQVGGPRLVDPGWWTQVGGPLSVAMGLGVVWESLGNKTVIDSAHSDFSANKYLIYNFFKIKLPS